MELSSIDRIMNERRSKALELKKLGLNPYDNTFKPTIDIKEFVEKYKNNTKEELEGVHETYKLVGRVLSLRKMGKAAFLQIKDRTGSVQIFLQKDLLAEKDFSAFELTDVGDFIGVLGSPMKTKTGELSIKINEYRITAKTLRPLPEKWHGLTNVEQRYRQRELDLISNEKAAWIFQTRSKIIRFLQKFLDERGFVEVETPVLMDIAGGAEAKPFMTHHNKLNEDLSLRIATEIFLKRLVVGGIERVYEIGRIFRNEGVSTKHNPEFTSVEFYHAYATYEDMMLLTEQFLKELVFLIHGKEQIEFQGNVIDFSKPFRKVPIAVLVAEHLGFSKEEVEKIKNIDSVKRALEISYKHFVTQEEPFVICLRELSVDEMNEILSPFFAEEKAVVSMDLVSVAKRISKEALSLQDVMAVGEMLDKKLSKERRRRLALHLLYGVFDHEVEDTIIQPTFITDFSVSTSPLARRRDSDPAVVDRFELIISKMEIANSFSEINDADDQKERFVKQAEHKAMGNEEACDIDYDFIHSLEVGMPPCAGEGIGIDRLVMLMTDSPSIREVILFPKMRRK